jgi:hypothetical protein
MIADSLIWWNDPATWPWMFHTRATFALAGLANPAWNWFHLHRVGGWPTARARIESIEITEPKFSFTIKRGNCAAERGH